MMITSKMIDAVLGGAFGILSAAILVCCLMTSLSVIIPKIWEPYDRNALLLPFDRLPIGVFQAVERNWARIPPEDPGHTRFPTFDKNTADDLQEYWR